MECEFCKSILKTANILKYHQTNSKKCLEIQANCNSNIKSSLLKCEFCKKEFSSLSINRHYSTCKYKLEKERDDIIQKEIERVKSENQKEIENGLLEIEKIKSENQKEIENSLIEKEKIIIEILSENKNYKEQIKKLEEQNRELQHTIVKMGLKAIERPSNINNTTTNTTTNNTLNITSTIDFNDVDKVKNIIENKLDINYVIDGQKGIANFIKDNILRDDNGELIYVCTDPSRGVFKFKDTTGELKKDIEAKKLTSYILEGGIKKKSAIIGNEWCKDNSGEFDIKKFTILMVPQQSIMNLSQDNNVFKKELAALTS